MVSGYAKIPPRGEKRKVEGNVTVISGTQVVGTIPLGRILATHVVADPINGYIYVGGIGGEVVVIQGMERIAQFETGSVEAMDVNPKTGDVYVLNASSNKYLYHFKSGELIDAFEEREKIITGYNMRVHPVTGLIYIVDVNWHQLIIIRDMEIIGRVPLGDGPRKMTIDPLTENVYVANFRDDSVTVVHGTEVLTTVQVGWYPYGIGVNPVNGWVYVSNTNDDTITVLGVK